MTRRDLMRRLTTFTQKSTRETRVIGNCFKINWLTTDPSTSLKTWDDLRIFISNFSLSAEISNPVAFGAFLSKEGKIDMSEVEKHIEFNSPWDSVIKFRLFNDLNNLITGQKGNPLFNAKQAILNSLIEFQKGECSFELTGGPRVPLPEDLKVKIINNSDDPNNHLFRLLSEFAELHFEKVYNCQIGEGRSSATLSH